MAKFYLNSPLGVGNKTFVSVLVFISFVCVYIRVKPIITARIVTICWAVSQSVYDGRELNAAVLTSMVRAVWVSFCFDLKCWDLTKAPLLQCTMCAQFCWMLCLDCTIFSTICMVQFVSFVEICILTVLAWKHSCPNVQRWLWRSMKYTSVPFSFAFILLKSWSTKVVNCKNSLIRDKAAGSSASLQYVLWILLCFGNNKRRNNYAYRWKW